MPANKTLRKKIIDFLQQWKSGAIDEVAADMEGEYLCEQYVDDESDADCDAIEEEVLILLGTLFPSMVTVDDVPAFIKFLQTPPEEEKQAFAEWSAYWDSIDFDERHRQLAANPNYPPPLTNSPLQKDQHPEP